MNDQLICAQLRPKFGAVGLALLVYYGIMNAAVMLISVVQAVVSLLPFLLTDPDAILSDAVMDSVLNSVVNNGWGYLLATLIGAVVLLLWKNKQFCFHEIWQRHKPLTGGSFFMLLCIFLSAQAIVQLMTTALEWFFNLFDMSIMDSLESMNPSGDSLSMFLYMGLAAPIFEEILFRGLVLRTLEPYGRKFAILGSAFLFGIFHGNILQTPFAFAVGLILGYVTLEYSIVWAMVLHLINNLILGDLLTRLMQLLPPWVGELSFAVIVWGSLLAAVIILIVKRKQVLTYFTGPKIHPLCLKSFFTSPGILVLTGVMGLNILLSVLMMIFAQI